MVGNVKPRKPKLSIGLEIEVNQTRHLNTTKVVKHWQIDGEHCGFELRSEPAKSPGKIRELLRSVSDIQVSKDTTFKNTGTHLHIDFLNDNHWSPSDLKRIQVKKVRGRWSNPIARNKRYYWLGPDGKKWAAPQDYYKSMGKEKNPRTWSTKKGKHAESVKRFMLIGKRFAHVLFALQHPDRRFNKYCHSLNGWDEDVLMGRDTVNGICIHPNLLQNHRRHMFNPLSFQRFGTVEVRMIKGTLNERELRNQIFLFGKLANLAKSMDKIPEATDDIIWDFSILMNAAGIHGKMRRLLTETLAKRTRPRIAWYCKCFECGVVRRAQYMHDMGLSRPVCQDCMFLRIRCCWCGYVQNRTNCRWNVVSTQQGQVVKIGGYQRAVCDYCSDIGALKIIESTERKNKTMALMGTHVGSGFNDKGPNTLERIKDAFKAISK